MSYDQLVALLLAIGGSAGLWKYLSQRAAYQQERMLHTEEHGEEFTSLLIAQIRSLDQKVDKLLNEKDELLLAIADLKADLASAKATIAHLETMIRFRN
jgi:peptidoglycan hydrolase CwlO-like protein